MKKRAFLKLGINTLLLELSLLFTWLCTLNFTAAKSLMSMTSIDCWGSFAPLLANVICCPQLEATLVILIGQYSKDTNTLALNGTLAKHCLSDIEQILVGQGASEQLKQICSIHPSNLTEASCPAKDVTVDSSKLLAACGNIDPVKECCDQSCQSAILEAATRIALKSYHLLTMDGSHALPDHSTRINYCKSIVLRWLASKLGPSRAKFVRWLSLTRDTWQRAVEMGQGTIQSAVAPWRAMCLKQSLVTNLLALNCAASLGMELHKSNITQNVYSLCRISLKDFSLQVGNQESGCLLPSLPSDATFDMSSGVSFICDLNDHIPAPWPSMPQLPASCNKSLYDEDMIYFLLFAYSVVLMFL